MGWNTGIIVIIASACLHCTINSAKFRFAIYNNEIFVNRKKNTYSRGYQTLYGLIQLQYFNKDLPNVYARIDGIDTDGNDRSELAFWRRKGTNVSYLWPEHDYFGWPDTWSTIYPLYAKVMKENSIPWENRFPAVYWSGTMSREIRRSYLKCSRQYPLDIVSQTFDWMLVRPEEKYGPFSTTNSYKPIFMDSRKRMMFKYGIYFNGITWSSSFKRIVNGGGVLIMPAFNLYETLMTMQLETHCSDCYLTYNESLSSEEFCNSLLRLMGRSHHHHRHDGAIDHEHRMMAESLKNFTEQYYSLNATLEYMLYTLQKLSLRQNDQSVLNYIKDAKLQKINCSILQTDYVVDAKLKWQYQEWYDSDCRMILNSSYLSFTAL
jgi:hypothetical protein